MSNKNNKSRMNRWAKSVIAGTLALSVMIPVGAASAAPINKVYYNTSYNVSDSDTMYQIAKRFGIDLSSLIQANPQLNDPNCIWSGMQVTVPGYWGGSQGGTGNTTNPGTGNVTKPSTGNTAKPGTGSTANPGNGGTTTAPSTGNGGSQTTTASQYASDVVNLVNQERAKAGLKALQTDSKLTQMALDKAKDMYSNNYFDHNSPTYGSPFDMMRSYGISYRSAGENIAKGQRNPQEVMNAWMNSDGHRRNIMDASFTKIGVAYYNGEWVQEFIG